jgi:hypothetical protein
LKRLIAALLLALPLATAASAQQPADQAAQPAPAEKPADEPMTREQAVDRMVDTYATVLFASHIEKRCDHLDPDMERVFFNNLITIENFMVTLLPPEAVVSLKNNAAKEGQNAEANPCSEETKEFIRRVFPVAAQLAENITQAAGLTRPKEQP